MTLLKQDWNRAIPGSELNGPVLPWRAGGEEVGLFGPFADFQHSDGGVEITKVLGLMGSRVAEKSREMDGWKHAYGRGVEPTRRGEKWRNL